MSDGDLYASPRPPRPTLPHANAAGSLFAAIHRWFHHKGPGGWILLFEPELHYGNHVLVPDLAGWRRARLPNVPPDAYLTLAPDWICEVLTTATEAIDRCKKLPMHARHGVAHTWLVEPLAHTLEVLTLEAGCWVRLGRYAGEAKVRAAPFDAIELELDSLWI